MTKEDDYLLMIKSELRSCNYTSLKDYVGKNKKEWLEYRQALRDLPSDPDWPDVEWPVRPKEPPLKDIMANGHEPGVTGKEGKKDA